MAYFNLLASVPESAVEVLRRDPSHVVAPSLILGASHLLASVVQARPLGGLLGRALDGGEPLHPGLWHPLRPPGYHRPPAVVELVRSIDDAWAEVSPDRPPEEVEWLSAEVGRLLQVFRHAAGSGECVVSALDAPADALRASRVRLPWSPALLPDLVPHRTKSAATFLIILKRILGGPIRSGLRRPVMPTVPQVAKDEFAALVRERFPDAEVHTEDINPSYRSWCVEVRRNGAEAHISWGPLTGFGGTDFGRPSDDPNIFSPFDVRFASLAEAEAFLNRVLRSPA